MEIEIAIHLSKEKDELTYKNVEVETPQFIMTTDVAFNILKNKNLKKSCFQIYLTILKHRNMKTNECFPSIETICRESGLYNQAVKDGINQLEEHGYLSINSGMRGISNNYYFPKEWFYPLFSEDFYQKNATRRHKPLKDKRKTKLEKENEELKEENIRLKQEKFIDNQLNSCYNTNKNNKSPF